MLSLNTVLTHYKRGDIQEEMILHAKDKECVGSFKGEGYAKRPDVLNYPRDILELAKQGVTSFHASEEIWSNPLQIDPTMRKQDVEDLRIGWDLIIDIDCPYFEYSKIAADLIVKALKHHNIEAISIKFSGNKGFHIGVPFEAFPKTIANENTSKRFPDATKDVAIYLKDMVKEIFTAKISEMENGDINKISENLKKKKEDLLSGKIINSDKALDIDTILISSRHLYRMPYSLHEKSGLCSIPIDHNNILDFKKEQAIPENVKIRKDLRFLDRTNVKINQAKDLFDKAIAEAMNKKEIKEFRSEQRKPLEDIPVSAIPEQFFPPCIQNILKGLEDGKKRSLFILTNFLTSVGWSYEKIEALLKEWNKKNNEPLRDVVLLGQTRYHKQQKKNILPPNCQNSMYYKDFAVCKPDNLCQKIKNPVQYAKRKVYYLNKVKNQKNKPNKSTVNPSKSEKQ